MSYSCEEKNKKRRKMNWIITNTTDVLKFRNGKILYIEILNLFHNNLKLPCTVQVNEGRGYCFYK